MVGWDLNCGNSLTTDSFYLEDKILPCTILDSGTTLLVMFRIVIYV